MKKIKFKLTLILWSIITIIFFTTQHVGLGFINIIRYGAMYRIGGVEGEWWRMITYGFLHNDVDHWLGNMLIGIPLTFYMENKTNSLMTFVLFMAGVFFGGLAFMMLNTRATIATTGASAGIWGLLGAATINLVLDIKRTKKLEYMMIAVVNVLLFYDTWTATNVNAISHYYGYIATFILMIPLVVLKHEKIFKRRVVLG